MGWRQEISEARRVAQPPVATFSLSDHVYRFLSIYPSVVLAKTGMHPNEITGVWITLGLVALVPLGSASQLHRIGGALLLQVSYLLDFVDGEVARLQARTSKRG